MKTPIQSDRAWIEVDETESTQALAAAALQSGKPTGVILAHNQTQGRGRFGRVWVSQRGDSLTYSLLFHDYADLSHPYLVGMAVAVAAAGALHCQLQWPNDLVIGGKKVGGILTELMLDRDGARVPVVGVGINLNQAEFPSEIAHRATSLHLAHGGHYDAKEVALRILSRLQSLPEPTSWSSLAPIWMLFDATPGKRYRVPTGEEAIALGIGPEGQLLCSVDGESQSVMAAEALFGPSEEPSP